MTTAVVQAENSKNAQSVGVKQYSTFHVGDMVLGVEIGVVQEINRQVNIRHVPNSPDYVRGVINLRGEVATVIDLRTVLGLPETEETRDTRNLIVHSQGEAIGLWVDKVSDILSIPDDKINAPPSNISGVDGRFFRGVYSEDSSLVVLLDIEQALAERD